MYESITLIANLGSDPVLKYLKTGKAICNFSAATNQQWTNNNGEKVKKTTWWRVSTFGKTAEAVNQYLSKGSKVLITGRMNADENGSPRIWTDKSGTPKASFEITAETVKFLDSRSEPKFEKAGPDVGDGDDLPF